MVWYKVNDNFQTIGVGALHQILKLGHTVGHVNGQIGVNVVIIFHRVGRPGQSLHHRRIIGPDTEGRIIGGGSVFEDTGEPDMRSPESFKVI